MTEPSDSVRKKRTRRAVAALFTVAVAFVAWRLWPVSPTRPKDSSRPEDPRLTFDTPYLNVRPEVQYVGDEACAGCHSEIAGSFRRHPMGRSLAPVASSTQEQYDAGVRNPFDAAGFRYQADKRGGRVFHRESVAGPDGRPVLEKEVEVHFAVGSGTRGRSYLTHKDGFLTMSPITWYPQKQIWDLSPGYEQNHAHFTRSITPDCLFCHANRVEPLGEPLGDAVNRYREPLFRGMSIGCERCHGPGELHVRRHRSGDTAEGVDHTIVNPGRLEHSLRESVCQQCHLKGQQRIVRRGRNWFDYRPGLPFHLFFSEFVTPALPGQPRKFVGAVEQMYASRCFERSRGEQKLGCISCHDPHEQPAADQAAAFYRARCLNCHADTSCGLADRRQKQPDDSCTACHMPKTGSNVSHTALSDHRIPRRPEPPPATAESVSTLRHFHRDLVGRDDPEAARDFGLALVGAAEGEPGDAAQDLARQALPLLEAALARAPDDASAAEGRARALWFLGRLDQAMIAFEQCLQAAPRREEALARAAKLALRLGRLEEARRYAEQAVAVNPGQWQYRHELAVVYLRQGDGSRALAAAREALELNPAAPATRHLLIEMLVRARRADEASAELERLLAVVPAAQREALQSWFAKLSGQGR